MQIVLARHGKPNLQYKSWITPREMKEWIDAYNRADVLLDDVPADTLSTANASGIVVSSTLPRSIQSAQYLVQRKTFLIEPAFCEADLPYSHWPFPKLPLAMWSVGFRLAWFSGFSQNAEPLAHAKSRAIAATERLIDLAEEHGSVFLVGHGIMMMLIAKELRLLGWTGPKRPADKYWQYSIYRHLSPSQQN